MSVLSKNVVVAVALGFSVSGLVAQPQTRDEPPPPPYQQQYPQQPYAPQYQPPPPPPPQQVQYPQYPQQYPQYPQQQYPQQRYPRQQPPYPQNARPQGPAPAPAAQYPHRNGKWQMVSQFNAAGSAKEVNFNGGGYSQCKIECIGGRVGLNTVVIRRGGKKQSVTARTTLTRGQEWSVPIDRAATGIRISDNGGGTYKVWVR